MVSLMLEIIFNPSFDIRYVVFVSKKITTLSFSHFIQSSYDIEFFFQDMKINFYYCPHWLLSFLSQSV